MRVLCLFFGLYLACPAVWAQARLMIAESFGKMGLINASTYEIVVPYQYVTMQEGSDGTFLACEGIEADGKTLQIYFDARGKEFLRFHNNNRYEPFSEGLAVFSEGTKAGYIDKKGNVVTKPLYTTVFPFREGLGLVCNEKDEHLLLNAQGAITANLGSGYYNITRFVEGMAFASKGDKSNIDPITTPTIGYSEEVQGEVVLLDKKGNVLKELKQDNLYSAQTFQNGLAVVGKLDQEGDGDFVPQYGVMDKTGKLVLPTEYRKIEIEPTGHILATRFSGEAIVFDRAGKAVLNGGETKEFYTISPLFGGRFRFVQRNDQDQKWGVLDMLNYDKLVVPTAYKQIFFRAPTDFWAVREWSESNNEQNNIDGSWEVGYIGKESKGEIDFFTYTRKISIDKVLAVYDRANEGSFGSEAQNSVFAYRLGNKWGLMRGFTVQAVGYDDMAPFAWTKPSDLIGVRKRDKWGYINSEGIEIFAPQFDEVTAFENHITPVKKAGKWALWTKNGKPSTPFEYDDITSPIYKFDALDVQRATNGDMYEVKKNGLLGVIGSKGEPHLGCSYQELIPLGGIYFIGKAKGKYGITEFGGFAPMPFIYDEITPLKPNTKITEQLFKVKQNGKYSIVNFMDEPLNLGGKYDQIKSHRLEKNAWFVSNTGKWGLVQNGVIILPIEFDEIKFSGAYALVKKAGKSGVYRVPEDSNNPQPYAQVLPCEYDEVGSYYSFLKDNQEPVPFKQNGLIGIMSADWRVVLPATYEEMEVCSKELVIVSKNKKWGVIGLKGKVFVPLEYDLIERVYAKTSYLRLSQNGRQGASSLAGEIIVPLKYDEIGHFTLDVGLPMGVKQKGKWGYINAKNKMIISPAYDDAKVFEKISDGQMYAIVQKAGKWGLINAKGKIILPAQYDTMRWEDFQQGGFYVEKDTKQIYIDLKGNEWKK